MSESLLDNNKGNLEEDQLEDIKIIFDGGNDLLALINDIMDLSKVEAGMLRIYSQDVQISTLKSNLIRLFKPIAAEKSLEFKVEVAETLSDTFQSDSQRVEQILKNFLSNAFKFTTEGSVILKIHSDAPHTDYSNKNLASIPTIAFSVIDTGIGIPREKQHAIFEAFQQEDGSTSRKYGGTGLGLTISRELARLLSGEIQLKSAKDAGSIFTLYLPLETDKRVFDVDETISAKENGLSLFPSTKYEPQPVEKKLRKESAPSTPDSATAPKRLPPQTKFVTDDRKNISEEDRILLIIEDDPVFAKTLRDHARGQGYKCLVSESGKLGLSFAAEYPLQGILLDLGLPDMDGLQVLEQLKYNLKTRHVPVHVISAREDGYQSMSKGASGHLLKPVDKDDLLNIFNNITQIRGKKIREILIAEDNQKERKNLTKLLANKEISITYVKTSEVHQRIHDKAYDCAIVDLAGSSMDDRAILMQLLGSKDKKSLPPLIIYSKSELDAEVTNMLNSYSPPGVLKEADSPERLLDEVSLFIHKVESGFNESSKEKIRLLHDQDAMLQGRKVLLVDDDMRNTYALSKKLMQVGLKVDIAANGQIAVDKMKEDAEFELVIMDIMMPVMDGYEASRQIRKMAHYANIPILAITAKAMPEDRDKCLQAGASEYITKPIDFNQLLSLLRIWLFKHR